MAYREYDPDPCVRSMQRLLDALRSTEAHLALFVGRQALGAADNDNVLVIGANTAQEDYRKVVELAARLAERMETHLQAKPVEKWGAERKW